MAVGLVALRHFVCRRRSEHRFGKPPVRLQCGWEVAFWIPGEEECCFYHAESWTKDATWQAAATCVPPPGNGGCLKGRGIELGGCLWNYCWYLYMVVDAWTECCTTSKRCQDDSARSRESKQALPEKMRWGGEMVRPPRWRLEGRMMSRYINKYGGFDWIG